MHLNGEISVGNLLTIAAIFFAVLGKGWKIDLDVKAIKLWIKGHAECAIKQEEILNELREAISYMRGESDGRWPRPRTEGPERRHYSQRTGDPK